MRIASWSWGGRVHVGTISADGREATPLAVADATRGALPLIERLSRGEALPGASGARVAVEAISLQSPLPRPLRGLFCVGRNYHSHAAELADSVFRASLPADTPADRLRQARRMRGRALRRCLPGARSAGRLRTARGGDRPRQPRHPAGAGDGPCLRLPVVSDVPPATCRCGISSGTSARLDTFCPMGPWITTADRWTAGHAVRGGTNELRQDSHTRDLIFDIRRFVGPARAASPSIRDVIATGTPRAWAWASSRRNGWSPATW
jgi:hypothetical protein